MKDSIIVEVKNTPLNSFFDYRWIIFFLRIFISSWNNWSIFLIGVFLIVGGSAFLRGQTNEIASLTLKYFTILRRIFFSSFEALEKASSSIRKFAKY